MEGYTALSVVVSNDQYDAAVAEIAKYAQLMDFTASYSLNGEYQVLEIDMLSEDYVSQQLFAFAIKHIKGICYHQEGSTMIVVADGEEFRQMLSSCYGKDKKMYFVYDMLTISERYNLVMADPDAPSSGGGHLIHDENGIIYSLLFDSGCLYLFDSETELKIEDDYTGTIATIDMIENMDIYDFHIRILGKKLEKNTENIL